MAETEAEEDEGQEMERDSNRETPRGAWVEVIRMGGGVPPLEENADHLEFTPECAHMLFQVELLPRVTKRKPVIRRLIQQRHHYLTC